MRIPLLALLTLFTVACASSPRSGGGDASPELRAALERLLPPLDAQGEPVALVTASGRAVFSQAWSEEGTGMGLAVSLVQGGKEDRVEVFTPSDDPSRADAALAKARATLAKRLAGESVMTLPGRPWPPASEGDTAPPAPSMRVDGMDVALTFAGTKVEARDGAGKVLGSVDWADDVDEPHVGEPTMVFADPGSPLVLVNVFFDPGEGYSDGFNAYSDVYVLKLR